MQTPIGYIIPEFPGQTHSFFWREIQAMEGLGVCPQIVSTRRPATPIHHGWVHEAMGRTWYLFPVGWRALAGSVAELLRSGPAGWFRCARAILRADGKLALAAMLPLGAQLAWLARRGRWPYVHVHSCAQAANIALLAHLLSGMRYGITLHGPLSDYGPNQKQKWRHAALAVVITRHLFEQVRQTLGDSLPPIVEVAPMGVDLSRFRRGAPYQPWDGRGECRIFCCGRLNPVKGHDDAIRAVALLRDQGIPARLHIAGADVSPDRHYQRKLEQLIEELKVADHVRLLGAVPEQVVHEELESSHVFALASWHEPLGVAIMEAMAMSVPTIATAAGGVAELIDHDADGVLVPPRSPEQLAAALARLLRDADLARRLSEAGRLKVERSFHSGVSAAVIVRRAVLPLASPPAPALQGTST